MSQSDPIADLLTSIRNACKAKHKKVDIPASKVKTEIVRVLLREKYINNFKSIDDEKQGVLRVYLKYDAKDRPVIQGLERVSKPGRRPMETSTASASPGRIAAAIASVSSGTGTIPCRRAPAARLIADRNGESASAG